MKSFVKYYLLELESMAKRVSQAEINDSIKLLVETWKSGHQVFVAGNGGSATTAMHLTCDLSKLTTVEGKPRIRAICLNDCAPLISALTNDLGWDEIYIEQLRNLMQKGDLLVVISVHGASGIDKAGLWSQNLLKAAKFAHDNGGRVLALTGFDGGILKQVADISIVVPANSTPQVEGFHLCLTHLLCVGVRETIANSDDLLVA